MTEQTPFDGQPDTGTTEEEDPEFRAPHRKTADEIEKILSEPLDEALIRKRKGRGGKTFEYLAGQDVIAQLNEIFGPFGWSHSIREMDCNHAKVSNKKGETAYTAWAGCTARLEIYSMEPNGSIRMNHHEDEGFSISENYSRLWDAIGDARKSAATDALKRAAHHLGYRLGLALYYPKGERTEEMIAAAPPAELEEGVVRVSLTDEDLGLAPSVPGESAFDKEMAVMAGGDQGSPEPPAPPEPTGHVLPDPPPVEHVTGPTGPIEVPTGEGITTTAYNQSGGQMDEAPAPVAEPEGAPVPTSSANSVQSHIRLIMSGPFLPFAEELLALPADSKVSHEVKAACHGAAKQNLGNNTADLLRRWHAVGVNPSPGVDVTAGQAIRLITQIPVKENGQ